MRRNKDRSISTHALPTCALTVLGEDMPAGGHWKGSAARESVCGKGMLISHLLHAELELFEYCWHTTAVLISSIGDPEPEIKVAS